MKLRKYDYNLVVIGAGSGGLVSAYLAAALKARVALIEKNKMGGDCLNTGCVPSKALIQSAKIISYAKRASDFGLRDIRVDFSFSEVMERVQRVVGKVAPHDSVERFTQLGVECFQGEARIVSPYLVEVNGNSLATRNLMIATGAEPRVPKIPGLEKIPYLTSENLWNLRKLPKRLLVLGGGAIGLELAQSFQRLGSQVTIVEKERRLLFKEDEDVSQFIEDQLREEGVILLTEYEAVRFEEKKMICKSASLGEKRVDFDEVLIALGRVARVHGFGLERLGIQSNSKGFLSVDDGMRTHHPGVFACGDAVGPHLFTHMASHQATLATLNALFRPFKKFRVDHKIVPWAIFTDPEIARVGMNESEARAKGIPYQASTYALSDLDRAITDEEDQGFVKVLTGAQGDKILGATIVGPRAGEVIAEFVMAMKNGLGLGKILNTIHVYPTYMEMARFSAGAWKRAQTPGWVLNFLKKYHSWRRSP